jgi:protocatechuate 3,4-dioxygenase beta subunit
MPAFAGMTMMKKTLVFFGVLLLAAGAVYLLAVQPNSRPSSAAADSGTGPATNTAALNKTGEPSKIEKPAEKIPGVVNKIGNAKELEKILGGDGVVYGRVIDEDGGPIAGASVEIMRSFEARTTDSAMLCAYTLDNGAFRFEALKSPLSGYVFYNARGKMPKGNGFSITPSRKEINLGTITLFSGTPITIRVEDTHGTPLNGSSISFYKDVRSGMTLSSRCFTEDDGTSRIALPRGNYKITAKRPGFLCSFKNIAVEDVPLELVFKLSEGASISGKVIDDADMPVSGAEVRTYDELADRTEYITSTSDENGCFILAGLTQDKQYYLGCEHKDYERSDSTQHYSAADAKDVVLKLLSPAILINGSITDAATGLPIGYKSVSLSWTRGGAYLHAETDGIFKYPWPGEIKSLKVRVNCEEFGYASHEPVELTRPTDGQKVINVNLSLKRGIALSGRTYSKETGEPVVSASVNASFGENSTRVSSNADGMYILGGLEIGRAIITVNALEYAPYKTDVMVSENGATLDIPLTKAGTLSGTVKGENSEPVALALVEIELLDSNLVFRRTDVTDSRGRYRITGMIRGKYEISIADDNYNPKKETFIFENDTSMDFILKRYASITGVARDSRGEPVAGARVKYCLPTDNGEDSTSSGGRAGDDGIFHITGCKPGRGTITAECRGYVKTEKEITLSESERAEVEITLVKLCAISGRIVDEKGNLVPNFGLFYFYENGSLIDSVSYATGKFEYKFEPGRYRIVANANGFLREGSDIIELAEYGETANCTIVLKRGLSLSGCVVDETGAPIPGTRINLNQNGHPQWKDCDNNGCFCFTGLVEGECALSATKPGFYRDDEEVSANAGDSDVKITMNRSGKLILNVRGYIYTDISQTTYWLYMNNIHKSVNGYHKSMGYACNGTLDIKDDICVLSEYYPPGNYKLKLTIPGYKDAEIPEVSICAGETTELDVTLVPSE